MIVPHDRLSPEALDAVIEEYVTRDGTELSEADKKSAAVRRALDDGLLLLVYDPDADACNILLPDDAAEALQARRDQDEP